VIYLPIGEKIKYWRVQKGLSQKELGDQIGMSQQQIGQYETGTRTPKQETQIKIAKALGVHLRDLADNSWLEEIDRQLGPEKLEDLRKATSDSPIEIYLKSQGFTVSRCELKGRWENEDDPEERVGIPDEWGTVLSKDGHTATFTDAEFEELQAGAKEAIEGKFYKKVLEQQKKQPRHRPTEGPYSGATGKGV